MTDDEREAVMHARHLLRVLYVSGLVTNTLAQQDLHAAIDDLDELVAR